MRECTEPCIGRIGHQHVRNVYDRIPQTYCRPFADEEEFDNWCLVRLNRLQRWKWWRVLKCSRREHDGPAGYVLTHGDLSPRKVIVEDGRITGIV
ncbi:hypothetical protein F4859DRAFT_497245, partial [Xylaria cf. heliscus]